MGISMEFYGSDHYWRSYQRDIKWINEKNFFYHFSNGCMYKIINQNYQLIPTIYIIMSQKPNPKSRILSNPNQPPPSPKKRNKSTPHNFHHHLPNSNIPTQKDQSQQPPLIEKTKLENMTMEEQLQVVESVYNKIIICPQDNIKYLQTVFTLLKNSNIKVVLTAMRVLAQIFTNIAPLQSIDSDALQHRTTTQITKDQYKILKFQQNLLTAYHKYLSMLKQLLAKARPQNFGNNQPLYSQFKRCILQCVIKCIRTLCNFNYNQQLNDLCLKFVRYKLCRDYLHEALSDKNPSMLHNKIRLIAGIAKIIKNQQYQKRLPQSIIKIINCTYIDTRYLKKDEDQQAYRKKRAKRKMYREKAEERKEDDEQSRTLKDRNNKLVQRNKQKLKIKDEINRQFAQSALTIQHRTLVRQNSQLLENLFYIYFKFLLSNTNTVMFKDALDGVLKFVHCINVQLTQALFEHIEESATNFRNLWQVDRNDQLMELRILTVFTGQSIINGPLSIYNLDDIKMSTHFYKILKDINKQLLPLTKQLYRVLCITLDEMFIKRRQLSQQIVASVVRELAILLNCNESMPKLYLLEVIRLLAYKYGKISHMFEEDNQGYGLNSYNPGCEDPQCSNAINTEITSLIKNCKSSSMQSEQNGIKQLVRRLLQQNFEPSTQISLTSILEKEMQEGGFWGGRE